MKTIQLTFLLLVAVLSFPSYAGGDKNKDKVFDNASDWIPADFDTRKTTLLIANFTADGYADDSRTCKGVNAKMEEVVKECYPYKYAMVSNAELDGKKYADKDMYRFILTCDNGSHLMGGPGLSNGTSSYPTNTFHIYDRKLNKGYPATGHSAAYVYTTMRPTLNTIVKYLKGLK